VDHQHLGFFATVGCFRIGSERRGRGREGILTVGANTEVDLLLEGVGLEGLGDTQNGVLERLK
jgi:hypothetical protein